MTREDKIFQDIGFEADSKTVTIGEGIVYTYKSGLTVVVINFATETYHVYHEFDGIRRIIVPNKVLHKAIHEVIYEGD